MRTLLVIFSCFLGYLSLSSQNIAKNIVLQNLQGEKVVLNEVVRGDVVVMTFWATWCKPCQSELEALLELEKDWKDKVRILAVSIDDSRAVAKVKSLVKGKKWPFEILIDTNKELYKALNLTSVPYAVVIDKNGNIVYSHVGYKPGDEVELIEKALKIAGE